VGRRGFADTGATGRIEEDPMRRIAWIAALALALIAASALAGGKGKGKGKPEKGGGGDDGVDVAIRFTSDQRSGYHDWYVQQYGGGHCPPGLAKKHNGCLPPGQAKKRYAIGQPLPAGIVIGPIPSSLAVILGPAPRGHRYGIVDGDVVKLAVGTLLVVDAIQGLLD
jgi:hypothetical protein